jgi:PadR family transcriptional regulator, regulatory protein PadR
MVDGRGLAPYRYMSRVNAVQRNRQPSPQMIRVLRALAADPARWRYGYDLGNEVGLKSGSLYPLLVRLADRGLLEASWEPPVQGKPPRHLYRPTPAGLAVLAAVPAASATPSAAGQQRRLREA